MTAAALESAIHDSIRGQSTVTESVENIKVRHSEIRSDLEKLAAKLDVVITRQDQRSAEISTTLALLKKDLDDLKGRADESRKNRWALVIAIISAQMSLFSALVVAFFKGP